MGTGYVEIFWTGGFDSTFRVVQLSRLPVTVQPYYICDNRKSEPWEIEATRKITALLATKPNTHATILPLITYTKTQQAGFLGPEVTRAYQNILKDGYFGSQYDWLGRFAKQHPGIEMSIHKGGNAVEMIRNNGGFIMIDDDTIGPYAIANPETIAPDVYMLFKDCRFPLTDITKPEMLEEYARLGCEDVMRLTWFCYQPIKGKPCGLCSPCRQTIEEGLSARFSPRALWRHRHKRLLSLPYRCMWKARSLLRRQRIKRAGG